MKIFYFKLPGFIRKMFVANKNTVDPIAKL